MSLRGAFFATTAKRTQRVSNPQASPFSLINGRLLRQKTARNDMAEWLHCNNVPPFFVCLKLSCNGTALAAEADCIVSGDADLLVLTPLENIPILRAAEFLARL